MLVEFIRKLITMKYLHRDVTAVRKHAQEAVGADAQHHLSHTLVCSRAEYTPAKVLFTITVDIQEVFI